jgi:murein L,D-transpeptidase YcbB/YkuD
MNTFVSGRGWTALAAIVLSLIVGVSGADAEPSAEPVAESGWAGFSERLDEGVPAAIWAEAGGRPYAHRPDAEPNWTGPSGPTALADSLIAVLRDADRDGLRPGDYHVEILDSLRTALRRDARSGGGLNERQLADFELLATDAFLLYGRHLLQGRVDPVELTPTWTLSRRQTDLLQRLEDALEEGTIREALYDLRPEQPGYARLVEALRRYRRLAAEGGWPSVPDGPTLERGSEGDRVATLRARLRASGDRTGEEAATPASFDETLERAVVRFQERHGLEADGVVGPASLAALNRPVEDRIRQIEVNLERWRWLPEDLGSRYVLVNIAGFHLRVMEEGTDVMQMRVVTGRPYRQTPVFSDQISYLSFSPYWHVPHSLATRDKLPDFQKNPALVAQQGFDVFRGWEAGAQPVDPSTIDWQSLSAANFPYRLRQRPGPQNALGQVKFMFPNRHSVYLHDTPSRTLFERSERGFSSGCIRVERPAALAEYLLRDNEGWGPERIAAAMTQSQEQTVVLREKVPVHLLYWTAWVEDGRIQFRGDVYQRDPGVAAALAATPPPPKERIEAGGARLSPSP